MSVGCLVVVATWPHLVGARPRHVWALFSCAQLLFVPGVVLMVAGPQSPGWSVLASSLFLVGYGFFICWLVLLNARTNGWGVAARSFVDTLAAAVGMLLVLWAAAGVVGMDITTSSAINVVFPLVDVVALSQLTYLVVRAGRQLPAWWGVFAAVALQTVLDSAYVVGELGGGDTYVWVWVGYLASYVLCLLAFTHPSARRLGETHLGERNRRMSHPTRTVLVLSGVVLGIVALLAPGHEDPYEVVRSALVALLLLALFGRVMLSLTQASRAESESRYRATHDPVTGLLNRTAFHEALPRMAESLLEGGGRVAVVLVDIDAFHRFNDTWGHRRGDVLLTQIATALDRVVSREGMVARYGGDEFVVVEAVTDEESVHRLVGRIREVAHAPVPICIRHVESVTTAMGVAVGDLRGGDVEDLLHRGDAALAEAKKNDAERCVIYDDDLDRRLRHRAAMSEALRKAVADDGISVAFQPINAGAGFGRLHGWEALARWEDPQLGPVSPVEFIPLAEETGLICDLGDAILRRSLAEFAVLRARLEDEDLVVSINVSSAQLHQSEFRQSVPDAVRAAGVPPHAVQLEITESLLVDEDSPPIDVLEALRRDGFGIALDDFGTGYASFTTLRRLPLTCVKIDRSFVCRLGEEEDAPGQVHAVLGLVRSLHIDGIVAEGVETAEQAEILSRLGCPSVQGWLFGRPTPAAQILLAADAEAQGEASTRAVDAVESGRSVTVD